MAHLLGIDVGTSGTKSLVLDSATGKVLATHTVEHTLQTPKPGWTEQDPLEWWNAATKSAVAALRKAKSKPDTVAGIGLSGQMHGGVFLDNKGRIIRPAILWNDQRTGEQSQKILEAAGGHEAMLELTGNLPFTGYTAPKILWFREQEAKKYARLHKVVLPKDFVRFRLTGEYATDLGDGSGTCLVDVKNRVWSDKLLDLLKLDREHLPSLHESPEVTGTLHAEGARALELKEGIPVVAGAGDVMAGAVGMGVVERGVVNANLGTGGVMCAHSDGYAVDPQGRLATMCHAVPGAYAVFGCMLSAAGSLQWFADEMAEAEQAAAKKGRKSVFELLIDQADKAPIGSDGTFFLPHLTGERCPYNDPDARGGWVGVTRRTTRGHLVRSLIEGVTFNMAEMLDAMRDELKVPVKQIRGTGGGAKSAMWRQMQADVYNAPVAVTNSEEGAAFGAAMLAGVGAGIFKGVPEAAKKLIKVTDTAKPRKKQSEAYAPYRKVYAKLYGDLKDRFAEMAKLGT